jgi:hypothetical protein
MTYFSLKRTLLQYLNLVSESKYKRADNEFIPLLQNSGKPLPTMLRIGKSPAFCHPNIPLKKTRSDKTVIYASAISRKLEKKWRHPADEITTYLVNVLKNAQNPLSVRSAADNRYCVEWLWSEFSIYAQADMGMLCFKLSASGIGYWLQSLNQLPAVEQVDGSSLPVAPIALWPVQYVYGRCSTRLRRDQAAWPAVPLKWDPAQLTTELSQPESVGISAGVDCSNGCLGGGCLEPAESRSGSRPESNPFGKAVDWGESGF